MADVTLQHTSVNSGTAVTLHATSVSYGWKNLTNVEPIQGKYDSVEANFGGFENPKITLSGSFDIGDLESNELTQDLLVNFATLRHTTPIKLTIPTGSTPIYLKGRPTGGYETDGAQTLRDYIYIQIESFDLQIDNSSELGRFWNYNIVAHETS